MGKHFPTIIASIMLIAMLGLMSNCQVNTDVPLEYQSPMETSEHLDEDFIRFTGGSQITEIYFYNSCWIFLK